MGTKHNAYLTGRLIAVTEHYASKHFGPNTKNTMFQHPSDMLKTFSRYIDSSDVYYKEIKEIGVNPPITVHTIDDKNRMLVGYYHQLAKYNGMKTPISINKIDK